MKTIIILSPFNMNKISYDAYRHLWEKYNNGKFPNAKIFSFDWGRELFVEQTGSVVLHKFGIKKKSLEIRSMLLPNHNVILSQIWECSYLSSGQATEHCEPKGKFSLFWIKECSPQDPSDEGLSKSNNLLMVRKGIDYLVNEFHPASVKIFCHDIDDKKDVTGRPDTSHLNPLYTEFNNLIASIEPFCTFNKTDGISTMLNNLIDSL